MYKIKIEVPHIGGRIEKTTETSFPTIRVIGQELFIVCDSEKDRVEFRMDCNHKNIKRGQELPSKNRVITEVVFGDPFVIALEHHTVIVL
jgi:hypothetical protein